MKTKFIFITGGVVSSLGKGITAASLAMLLKQRGLSVTIQKFDPYLNVDPGTMNPYQHGEVFVTDSGAETDLDLGHYERFTDGKFTDKNNVTQGQIYMSLLSEQFNNPVETTLQVIPDVTNRIKESMYKLIEERQPDILIVEIGGTVGDIEGVPFFEAIRQMNLDVGAQNCIFMHVALVPSITSGEVKTKPAQHSVHKLREIGITPDFIICRSEDKLPIDVKEKIALFCNVTPKHVIQNINAESIYDVPIILNEENLDALVCERLGIETKPPELDGWKTMLNDLKNPIGEVKISVVGKYIDQKDAYISMTESFVHAGIFHKSKVAINWISAEDISEDNIRDYLRGSSGVLVPSGFGSRGVEGKILAIKYARENNIPFFGICLGMQLAVVEYARNVLGLKGAHTTEVDTNTPYKVIDLMKDQHDVQLGGTMRLGSYNCMLNDNTNSIKAYGKKEITERHRHRYEFNNEYINIFTKDEGVVISGINNERDLVEIIEIPNHRWFTAVQFHPEFKSRPERPHPLFRDFVGAAIEYKKENF